MKNLIELLQAESGEYRISRSSAGKWVGVIVAVSTPVTFNIEPIKAIIVKSAPKGSPAEQYVNKALPLYGAVLSAKFEEVGKELTKEQKQEVIDDMFYGGL